MRPSISIWGCVRPSVCPSVTNSDFALRTHLIARPGLINCVPTEDQTNDDEETHPDYQCGWFGIRPKFLQIFRTPKSALFFLCLGSIMEGLVVNGLLNVVLSTLERVRYYLPRRSEIKRIFAHYKEWIGRWMNNPSKSNTEIQLVIQRVRTHSRHQQHISNDCHISHELLWRKRL